MADQKANMLLTMASVVMTLLLPQLSNPQYRLSVIALMLGCLVTLAVACYVVMPKLFIGKNTTAMSERGAEIEGMIRSGDWKAADEALEKLAKDSRAYEPESTEDIDFSKYETGNTDLEELRQRYTNVEEKGQSVLSLPLIRQFLKAKEAFEEAKSNQDAEKVGRILTWVEQELAKL